MQTFLVTGGAGFIGSNFIRLLLDECDDAFVVNVDLLTYAADPCNLAGVEGDGRYAFVRADARDASAMAGVFSRFAPDVVIHFAAESHVDRSIAHPLLFQETNVGATVALLEAARSHWERGGGFRDGCMFVHVSTDEVYGDLPLEPVRPTASRASTSSACAPCPWDVDAFCEDASLRPRSPYAASKASAEMFVRSYGETYGLPAVVVRCSNNYGPHQHEEKLIPKAIACALSGEPFPLYGSGANVRDWLYVKDCCRGILAAMRYGRAGEAYNLAGGCAMANLQLIDALRAALRDASAGRLALGIEHVADRPGHDRRYAMNGEKAAAELGWRPEMPFADGLRTTVAWYLRRYFGEA
ncbi:MAG: dTDP-glucose 4,6-dehydratase [Slackia sp.]|nr:dTDP-glucose 4,6-dehydratase [Slackia sp.]